MSDDQPELAGVTLLRQRRRTVKELLVCRGLGTPDPTGHYLQGINDGLLWAIQTLNDGTPLEGGEEP